MVLEINLLETADIARLHKISSGGVKI